MGKISLKEDSKRMLEDLLHDAKDNDYYLEQYEYTTRNFVKSVLEGVLYDIERFMKEYE